jgi:sugar lactone lactonase YvrE
LAREVLLPIDNPTMVAFAGAGLDVLYITSATHGRPGKPHEGGLFRFCPGVRGRPRPLFGHGDVEARRTPRGG